MSYILKLVNKALSDADLRTILGDDLKIIKYSELDNYSDLDELLPNELDYCIVLYEEKLILDTGCACANTVASSNSSIPMALSQIAR